MRPKLDLAQNPFMRSLVCAVSSKRRKLGLTQGEVAARAGLVQSTVGAMESGERIPSVDSVYRILVAIDLPIAETFGAAHEAALQWKPEPIIPLPPHAPAAGEFQLTPYAAQLLARQKRWAA